MDAVCPLMQRIFALNIVENLTDTNAITCGDDCGFIELILILSQRLLRTNIERVFTLVKSFVCITASCSDVGNIDKLNHWDFISRA